MCLFTPQCLSLIALDLYCGRSGGQEECSYCICNDLFIRSVGVVIYTKIVS